MKLKILIISDTHGLHLSVEKFLPKADWIIHAGDLTNVGAIHEMNEFMYWFKNLSYDHKIMIAGNHDLGLDNYNRYTMLDMIQGIDKLYYLEDSQIIIEGIKIWGSPMTPPFFNWAFMREPDQIVKHWDLIPKDTDILITHGPPRGILDYVEPRYPTKNSDDAHVGCLALRNTVDNIEPALHIFGHIHDMHGITEIGKTHFINASSLNDKYIVIEKPYHLIEFDTKTKKKKLL